MVYSQAKSEREIDAMREGGKILATIFRDLKEYVAPGKSERAIDAWVHKQILAHGATPTYIEPSVNFPGVICISTNDQVVHGTPTDYVLQVGDVVGFDMVITYKGMKTDAAFTMIVGGNAISPEDVKLVTSCERSLYAGIDTVRSGMRTGDIGAAVQSILSAQQLGIIRDLVGHGIGREMHEEPDVPNYGIAGTGTVLKSGDTIAIEPMATLGGYEIVVAKDGWTICTRDGSKAAHFEHTVLVTDSGVEILTQL